MKSNTFKYTKKSLIAFIVFFTFHISIVKSYATVLKINEIKKSESIFAVSFSSNPAADNGTITICEGQTITYTNTSTGVGTNPAFAWSFPGGNNTSETTEGPHTITYNNAGNFTTTLTIDGTSSNVNVVVNAGPNPSFSLGPNWGSTTFNNTTYFSRCGINSGNVNFTFSTDTQNTNSNTQHIINWGDGGPVTTFTGTNISSDFHNYPRGLYTINYTVTLENGCSTTKTFNVFIGASPSASVGTAGTPTLCDPSNVVFNIFAGAQNTNGTIYTFQVNDDSPEQIYTHEQLINLGGTFNSTLGQWIFQVTHNFTNVSCSTDSNINSQVYYNSFQASVTVSNPCGTSSNSNGPYYIQSKPEANFTSNPANNTICINSTVLFTDTTINGSNITPHGPGIDFECDDNYKKYWTIEGPSGLITVGMSGIIPTNIFINVTGNLGFNFGLPNNPEDWTSTATNTLQVTFLQPGTYTITLYTGSNVCGVTSETQTICVTPEVTADFTLNPSTGCTPTTVQIENLSSLPGCDNNTLFNWQVSHTNPENCPNATIPGWSFSSGNETSSEPEITFTSAGVYTIQLTTSLQNAVAGTLCQPDVKTQTITIKDKPRTTLTAQTICEGTTLTLNPTVFNCYASQAVTYLWDFSSNPPTSISSTTVANPTITFATAGTYNYTLTLTNECGSNTFSSSITVNPAVQISASGPSATCLNTNIPLIGSISGGTTFGTWTASITGGTFSPNDTTLSPTYTPPNNYTGTITFTLTSSDPSGPCPAEAISFQVVVNAQATADAGSYNSICENGTIQLNGTVGGAASTGSWTSSNGGSFSDPNSLTSNYSPPIGFTGTIVLTLTTNDPPGPCNPETDTVTITIIPSHIIASQPTTTQSICVDGTIDPLTVAYTGGVGTATYQWYSNTTNANSGGTLITGATNNSYTPAAFTTAGTYYFYATVTLSGNGCGSTTSNTAEVIVVADPIVDTQALATQTLCQNSIPTDLTISVSGGIGTFNYQWYSNTANNNTGGTLITGATNNSFTPPTTTVGTQYYYCVITQSGVGCNVISAVAQVIIVPAPTITTQPASSSVCENGTPTLLTVAYSNGTGTPTYQWFSNTTNNTIGGTAIAGATTDSYSPPSTSVGTLYYYCEITFTSGGCTSVLSTTAEVIINPLPTVSTQPTTTQSICVDGTIDPLTVAYAGGVGTATYQWYSNTTNANSGGTLITGATNNSYTPAAFTTAGTYYFYATVTLSGNGCGSTTSNTAEVIVVADPVVDTQALATQTLCQNSIPTDLTISVSGGIGTFNYQWYSNTTNSTTGGTVIPGETNSAYTPPTTTVGTQYYYCVITQSGVGCNVTSAVAQVIIVPAPTITTQPASSSVCENGTPTLLTVAYTNGTGTPTYQWFSNTTNNTIGGTAIAGATADSYSPPSTSVGTLYYYCEITFASGGCTSVLSTTAEVVINQIPVINDVTAIICSGEPYIFNSTNSNDVLPAGLQYSWDLLSMTPSGTISGSVNNGTLQNQFIQQLVNNSNGIATLVYEVTPIAGICTGNPFTITIEVYPRPDVIFDLPIQTICNETNTALVTLNSTLPGNITYNWTATIPTGITGAISSGTNVIPVQTLINNTNTPLTITYSATATFNYNGSSCEGNVFTYSITVNPIFSSSGVLSNYNGYNISVFGANDGSIDLTSIGGSGVYTYSWVGPNGFTSTNEDLFGLYAGTYTVTISDGYCTPIILTSTLTQPPELLVQSDLSLTINLLCYGDTNGAVGVLITQESVPPYDYQLYDSNGNLVSSIIDSTNLNPQFTGLIAGVYSLTIIDANGGQKTVTGLSVTQPDAIIVTATTTPITCYGANNASITLTATGGIGPYQANWDNLATGFYQNNLAAGDYTIVVTDNSGCTETIVVNIPEAPIFTINPIVTNISCYGANDGSINVNLVGGIQPISLTWNDGSTSGLVRNNLPPGTYTVTIVDSKPCTIIQTFNIIEPQPLILSANIQNALDCNDANSGAVNLLVSGGTPPFTFSWTNGTTTEDLTNIPAGNYAVVVTDSNGCTQSAQYSVNRPQPLTLNVVSDTNVNCETKDISQVFEAQVSGGVPPVQLSWSSGTVTGVNNEFMTTNQDGLVILTATDAVGCTTTYSSNVAIPVIGNESFNQTSFGYTAYGLYAILDPIQFTNTSTGDYTSIVWNFGDGTFSNEENPIHTYVQEGDYVVTLTVTYPFGCVYNHTISLRVEKGYLLVVPTAFTPNNDTLNDTFRPVTRGLKNVRLDVYDTWGSLIYSETGDVLSGWDGTIKGVKSENGNYNCKISAETFYGKIITAEETFVLIK